MSLARKQIETKDFDVVLLDIEMSNSTGLEGYQALKRLPALAEVPIIVVSVLEPPGEAPPAHIQLPLDPHTFADDVAKFGNLVA